MIDTYIFVNETLDFEIFFHKKKQPKKTIDSNYGALKNSMILTVFHIVS